MHVLPAMAVDAGFAAAGAANPTLAVAVRLARTLRALE
jgi:hypothetical protein